MTLRNTNLVLLIVLIVGLVIFGYFIMTKTRKDGHVHHHDGHDQHSMSGNSNPGDVQFIDAEPFSHHTFEGPEGGCDDPEFVDGADPESGYTASQLSVGVGPGLWGSGRHTSEMYGN